MTTKIYEGKGGRYVVWEKTASGMYCVALRLGNGQLGDKIRCDDYRDACRYRKAFIKIARYK